MAEDWRVTITLDGGEHVEPLLKQLHEHPLEQELAPGVAGRVAVSSDENKLFLYADTRWTAEAAERVVMDLAGGRGLHADEQLDRWHPIEERWEDASVPLPDDDEDVQRERERLDETETADSQTSGFASWEVRIEFSSHRDASAFADRAEEDGQPIVRRWKYVILGANDEDDARALAEQLQGELPGGATIHVEPGTGTAWEWLGDRPFAVFGGLSA
ncbi:MAG TPA: hypothetical protein VLK36_02025 [Gaiellaceae bacterium]|nr:hypothetical protein [Gaiellaceae bacterium]